MDFSNSNVDISNNLYVNGDVSFQRNLDISGKLITTKLKVIDDVSLNGNVDISNRLVVNGDFSLNANVTISNNLMVSGETILSTLKVSDLTNNRVVIVGPSGELEDDSNFTFDGSNLVIDTSYSIQIAVGTTNERPFLQFKDKLDLILMIIDMKVLMELIGVHLVIMIQI